MPKFMIIGIDPEGEPEVFFSESYSRAMEIHQAIVCGAGQPAEVYHYTKSPAGMEYRLLFA